MFKNYKIETRLLLMHPLTLMVLFDVKNYCRENKLNFLITDGLSTLEEDKVIGRKHSTHRTGRAFDLSVGGMRDPQIKSLVRYYNEKYRAIAAVSNNDSERQLVIDHIGTARHLHFQIHSKYSLNYDSLPLE